MKKRLFMRGALFSCERILGENEIASVQIRTFRCPDSQTTGLESQGIALFKAGGLMK
ncbi:hypothetical protein N786_01060 [Bacillus amyloliquefaciens UASWS BA1]|nr:hypothetical protein N786_01060 [Bacillus amyloliquefaciens UASWS BA1]